MAWYDTGTISLTNGNTTVTGAGTDFISGAQIGEALYAPDGNLYEIQSITSATLLVLADNYLGSTVSGQDYKIIPTQSLVADLAGQVTDLITDYSDVKDGAGAGKFNDGTVTSPAITFEQDQNNGLYRIGSDNWGLVAGGSKQVDISTTDVELNHSGNTKLATTATGVDVTGTVTADGLTVESSGSSTVATFNYTNGTDAFLGLDGTGTPIYLGNKNGDVVFQTSGSGYADKFRIANNGDVSFYEDTGTTAKFHWDASEEELNVIGQVKAGVSANPVRINSSPATGIVEFNSTDLGIIRTVGSTSLRLQTNSTDRLSINASGNVGVGTDTPVDKLHIYSLSDGFKVGSSNNFATVGWNNASGYAEFGSSGVSDWPIVFKQNASERARIDSSGNLLVGKTTTNTDSVGFEARATGLNAMVRDGGEALVLGRKTNDGSILSFRKDGSTVGVIGAEGGDLVIGTGSTAGLQFNDATPTIRPWNMSANTRTDGVCDLGYSNSRFKDLYLSGGVVFPDAGGIGSATNNKLDSYEEGTWTPDFRFSGGSVGVTGTQYGKYTKVGNKVTAYFEIRLTSKGTSIGQARIYGLPFVAASSPVDWVGSVCVNFANLSGLNSLPTAFVTDGTSYLNLYQLNSAGSGDAYLSNSNVGDGLILGATVTYFTNS